MKKNTLALILALTNVSLNLNMGGDNAYAATHSSHPTSHPSSHPTSHPTVHTSSRPATSPHTTAPHSSVTHNSGVHTSSGKGITGSKAINGKSTSGVSTTNKAVSPTSKAAGRLPQTSKVTKSIESAKKTNTYHSLNSSNHRTDYLYWRGYRDAYYRHPMFTYYYPWMPWWLWHSNHHEASQLKQEAQQKDMKWIKVDDKVIAVPKKIYDKIKVGDSIELVDDTHIKINGHVYSR